MWGQVLLHLNFRDKCRIIPTRVGTSFIGWGSSDRSRDHPHACGDKFSLPLPKWYFWGSSPRVWGQVITFRPFREESGIIPTRVGTRSLSLILPFSSRDHPHACGDKNLLTLKSSDFWGSSPRVWGQGRKRCMVGHSPGIIPTRVGTSSLKWSKTQFRTDHPHACGDKKTECG